MSIRISIMLLGPLHVWRSVHDQWIYIDIGDWQVWPPLFWPSHRWYTTTDADEAEE
jgi:hypothetical protein